MTAEPAIAEASIPMEQLALYDVGLWCKYHGVRLTNGVDFSFQDHRYLEEIYRAAVSVPTITVFKGSQTGLSEWAILTATHGAAYLGNVIDFFPTDYDVSRFSKARFNPLLAHNPEFIAPMVARTNEVHMKFINDNGHLHFLGLNSPTSVKSTPADIIYFDEYDECNPEGAYEAHQRIAHSKLQFIRYLSTPTDEDVGIDVPWKQSDQRHRWMWCEACGKHTTCLETDWPNCIHEKDGRPYRACVKCGKPLDLNHDKNEWVAKHPGAESRGRPHYGYWISQLQSGHVSLEERWEEWKRGPKFLSHYYNHVLAMPHSEADARLAVNHVLSLCTGHGMEHTSETPCGIGVDTGPKENHVVVLLPSPGGTVRVLWLEAVPWDDSTGFDGLDDYMNRYNGYVVMDGLGETERARSWVAKWTGRAWACFYTKSPQANYRWNDGFNGDGATVTVHQDSAMVRSHTMLQDDTKVALPRRSDRIEEFAKHCHAVIRKKVVDEETGDYFYSWKKSSNDDHFRRAFNFAVMALERAPKNTYAKSSGVRAVTGGRKFSIGGAHR